MEYKKNPTQKQIDKITKVLSLMYSDQIANPDSWITDSISSYMVREKLTLGYLRTALVELNYITGVRRKYRLTIIPDENYSKGIWRKASDLNHEHYQKEKSKINLLPEVNTLSMMSDAEINIDKALDMTNANEIYAVSFSVTTMVGHKGVNLGFVGNEKRLIGFSGLLACIQHGLDHKINLTIYTLQKDRELNFK